MAAVIPTKIGLPAMQRMVARCDPDKPLPAGDPLYIDLDDDTPVRGGDGASVIDELERTILFSEPGRPTCQLMSGFRGTGKTTELRRLRARFDANTDFGAKTWLIDFEEHIDPFVPIAITDVLRVLAYVLDKEAAIEEGLGPEGETAYLRRLFAFLSQTEFDIKHLGFEIYGANLMKEMRNNVIFRNKVASALAIRFDAFAREANETIAMALVRLRKATGAKRIVLLIDGLEKLRPVREEDRETMESAVETLFVQHAAWLRHGCDAVYTFPLWLRFRSAPLGSMYDREPHVLPMVKIAGQDGAEFAPGVEKLRQMVERRLDNDQVFGPSEGAAPPALLELIRMSGGYPRDLLRMVRELLFTAKTFPVTHHDTARVIARLEEAYAQVIRTPVAHILAEVARTHELPKGDEATIAQFGRLLDQWLILAYRNGREWYDVHPLAMRCCASVPRRSLPDVSSSMRACCPVA